MKTFAPLLLLALGVLMSGCKNESIDFGGKTEIPDGMGYLNLGGMSVQVANYAEELSSTASTKAPASRAAGETTEAADTYKVRIKSVKTLEESVYAYSDIKKPENQKLPMTPGTYTVSAESEDYEEYVNGEHYADWEKPVYAGSVTKNVIKNMETTVDDLVCTLANIKTTVTLSQDLQNLFMPDAEAESSGKEKLAVTLSIGEHPLVFDRTKSNSGAAGYFKAVETSNTLKIVLSGHYNKAAADEAPNYVPVNWQKEITNCKAGQWRKISINVLNADKGNAQFQITVENWVYDEKIDVDVMTLYAATEETIPDEDISDENSPVVTLEGADIANGYTINGSMYDEELGKWNDNMKTVFTPTAGSSIQSIDLEFESDNEQFMTALEGAGFKSGKAALWPENSAFSSYVLLKEAAETSVITATVKDAGMSALFKYQGNHVVKYIVRDSENRTSYTKLTIRVTESGSIEAGPTIVWTNQAGTYTYNFDSRYNHNEVEIKIGITTQSAFSAFTVDIISDNVLTPDELAGVGLSSHMDLINPGQYESALRGLGFPTGTEVTNNKSLSFDITQFMSMLTLMNKAGNCDFRLTVTDASGTNTKTIQLYVVKQ